MPYKYEINGQLIEFQNEPTEQDIDDAASQLSNQRSPGTETETINQPVQETQQAEDINFSFVDLPPVQGMESPLTFKQNVELSLLPSDESRIRYIRNEFPNASVRLDEKEGLLINGRNVNPKGFDFGDLPRNAGNVFPIAGQILGSMLGFTAGATVSSPTVLGIPAGAAVGAAAGGTTGAVIGKGIQLSIGSFLGLDVEGEEIFNSIADEAKLAASSEALGLGMTGIGKRLIATKGASKVARGLSNIWNRLVNKLGKDAVYNSAKFAGSIDDSAARFVIKENSPSKILIPKNFDPTRAAKIANKILTGDTTIDFIDKSFRGSPIKTGAVKIAKSIKEIDNPNFDALIQSKMVRSGLSDESIEVIKRFSIDDIVKNSSPDNPGLLARELADSLLKREQFLGREIGKHESKVLKKIGDETIDVSGLVRGINSIIKEVDITKGIKEWGFKRKATPSLLNKEVKILNQIADLFKAEPTAQMIKSGSILDPVTGAMAKLQKGKKVFMPSMSIRNLSRTRKQFDLLADKVFKSKEIPSGVKVAVRDIARSLRGKYFDRIGLTPKNRQFHLLRNVIDDINLDKTSVVNRLESSIANFNNKNLTTRGEIASLINILPKEQSQSIASRIRLSSAAKELSNVDLFSSVSSLEGALSRKTILNDVTDDAGEILLKQLDGAFRSSGNINLFRRSFFKDAQASLAAKEFLSGSPELLRITAMARLTGLGALVGTMVGGPIGTLAGGVGALTISNPRTITRMLVGLDKAMRNRALKSVSSRRALREYFKNMTKKELRKEALKERGSEAVLRAIIGRSGLQQR